MKRILSFALVTIMSLAAWADEVTFDFSSVSGLSAMGITAPAQSNGVNLTDVGTVIVDGVSLTAVNGSTETRVWNSQGTYSLRVYVGGSITFSVASGSIVGVTINAANTTNFDLFANVGNYSADGSVGTWTGSTSSVTFSHTTTKNAQIASVVITTSTENPIDNPGGEDPNPVDPNITKLDSLANLELLDDDTEFQFTTEAYVQYQWENYLWLMQLDEEYYAYAAMVYGNVGRNYQIGDVIPAGWTGVKTTYKGLVEITNPTHFNAPIGQVGSDYTDPFIMTGYLRYIESDHYENMRVKLEGISLSDIDESGNFTITSKEMDDDENPITVTMAGYNKFGIEYPEVDPAEKYVIDGMVTIFNNKYQIYPITIDEAPGTRLWHVTYDGLEGDMKIADSLYVVLPMTDNQILVTDNADVILVDTYAEWGYTWYQEWYPTWIALDCGDDSELYEAIKQMEVLAPNSVKGEVVDSDTNPRIILSSTPTAITDPEFEGLHLYSYNISQEKLQANGHEFGKVTGMYELINGEPYLCSAMDTVQVRLDFSLNPDLQSQINEYVRYDMMCVFKLDEPWESSSSASYAPKASFKPLIKMAGNHMNTMARKITQPKRVNKVMKVKKISGGTRYLDFKTAVTDADYFTNYTIYPVSASITTGIENLNSEKQVTKVSYVNMMGVTSDTPFNGVNIVVTEFSDGTRVTAKLLK